MGACVTHNTGSADPNDNHRIHRQGNLTFFIYGNTQIENKTSGSGIKKTPAWYTDLSEQQILQKIQEFWETRIDGNQSTWTTLRKVCQEQDQSKCKVLIKAAGLSLVNGSLLQVYDPRGHRYDLPVFVINPALKYGHASDNKPEEIVDDKEIKIFLRFAGKSDIQIAVRNSIYVSELKKLFKEANGMTKDVRMFFKGQEMKNEFVLGHYKLSEGFVVIVF